MFLRRDLVVAAAGRVGAHQLPVGQHDRAHQHDDGHRDPRREVEEGSAADGQDEQDLLRGVRDARQRVAGEDRQRQALGEQRVPGLLGRHRAADDQPLEHARQQEPRRRRIRSCRRRGAHAERLTVRPLPGLCSVRLAGRSRRKETCRVHIVVMGCGRVGSSLALQLVERDARASRSSTRTRSRSAGSATTSPAQAGQGRRLRPRHADRGRASSDADAFAAVSSGDNSNIIAARVARETFGVQTRRRPDLRPQAGRGVRAARHPDRRHRAVDGQPAAQERARRGHRRGVARPVRRGRHAARHPARGLGRARRSPSSSRPPARGSA